MATQDLVVRNFFSEATAPSAEVAAELGLSIQTLYDLRNYTRNLEELQLQSLSNLEFERGEPKSISIEITEAISQNAAKLQAELERDGRAEIYHVPEHKHSESRQDLEMQRKIV